MSFYTRAVRPVLFSLDAERAHDATMAILASRLGQSVLAARGHLDEPRLRQRVWSLDFDNPLGLAAGLDKQGRAVPAGNWQCRSRAISARLIAGGIVRFLRPMSSTEPSGAGEAVSGSAPRRPPHRAQSARWGPRSGAKPTL